MIFANSDKKFNLPKIRKINGEKAANLNWKLGASKRRKGSSLSNINEKKKEKKKSNRYKIKVEKW